MPVHLPTYPKAFFAAARLSRERDRVFVAMPFDAPHSGPLWNVMGAVCGEMHPPMTLDRADLASAPSLVVGDILEKLERAEIVVADLTGNNPNVLYEVGLAHARCEAVILIAYRGQSLAFDLAGLRCLFFDLGSPAGKADFKRRLRRALEETRSVGPPQIIDSPLARTQAIVNDLQTLLARSDDELCQEVVWFSGALSAFAISESESFETGDAEYRRALLRERDLLLDLARRGCTIRCIITPTARGVAAAQDIERLSYLCGFLESSDEALRSIDWAVSEMRQKNMYVIGKIAAIEGFRDDTSHGYRVSFRQSSADAVSANVSLYEKLFETLRVHTLSQYSSRVAKRASKSPRDILREATVFCLRRTLQELRGAEAP